LPFFENHQVAGYNAEAELKYRTLFDQSPDGILILDQEEHILDFNTSAHLQLGIHPRGVLKSCFLQ
jgi:PAS domain S-box-containing protein